VVASRLGTGWIRRARSRPLGVTAIAGLCVVLSACGGDGATTASDGSPASKAGGPSGTLTVAMNTTGAHTWAPSQSGGETLGPLKHISDSLVTRNDEGEYVPMLATSWKVSRDGKTWTFNLRPGVKFHGGRGTMTAEDVKFTWKEWMRRDSNQNTGPQLSNLIGGDIDNIEIVDDLTFKLHLPEPNFDVLELLLYPSNSLFVTSKKYHEEDPNADKHPVGTGPWEFVSSRPGVEVVMKANHDYWGTVPSFEDLVIKEIPDSSARLAQIRSGQLDISPVDSNLVEEAKNADVRLLAFPDIGTLQVILGGMYYGDKALDPDAPWIQADQPEKGLAIRQAMSLAIDRELILETILGGYGEVALGPLVQFNSNPDTADPAWRPPEFNLEEAKRKLAEGGYPDGFPVEVFLYADDVDTVGVGQAIAGMWEDLGLQVKRRASDEDTLDPLLNEKKTSGFVWVKQAGWDPFTIILDQYTSFRNDGDYKLFHPALDQALVDFRAARDQKEKDAVVREMITKLRDDMAMLPLFEVDLPVLVGPRVGDWKPVPGDKEPNALNTVTHAD
jgi:peptide/nickel transport system substrate-binding protein